MKFKTIISYESWKTKLSLHEIKNKHWAGLKRYTKTGTQIKCQTALNVKYTYILKCITSPCMIKKNKQHLYVINIRVLTTILVFDRKFQVVRIRFTDDSVIFVSF